MRSFPQGKTPAELLRVEAFESSLHPRLVGRAGLGEAAAWRLIYLEQGDAELLDGAETLRLSAPCIAWQPSLKDTRIRIGAGAVGIHVLLGAGILADAIGHKPESPELRFMTERRALVFLQSNPALAQAVAQAMSTILEEARRENLAASRTVIEAALRIVLVNLWRAQGASDEGERGGTIARRYMDQFNNLVQANFRQRWTVARYADALGITADRLNDICKRVRGRTPGEVIASRLGVEARLLLENSLHPLDQIASDLGFPGAAQFNRFFKSLHGVPPGQYRREQLLRGARKIEGAHPELYEWP